MEFFTTIGTLYLKKSYHNSLPNELWTCPDDGAARAQVLVVNVVVVGPFEEEEEGIGVTTDVVKVKGEDPDTPGF